MIKEFTKAYNDMLETLESKRIELSDLTGKRVVLYDDLEFINKRFIISYIIEIDDFQEMCFEIRIDLFNEKVECLLYDDEFLGSYYFDLVKRVYEIK